MKLLIGKPSEMVTAALDESNESELHSIGLCFTGMNIFVCICVLYVCVCTHLNGYGERYFAYLTCYITDTVCDGGLCFCTVPAFERILFVQVKGF